LLRDREQRYVSPLPCAGQRFDLNFWVIMLRQSIGLLRSLSYQGDTIRCTHAFSRNDGRQGRTRYDARDAPAGSTAARHVLLTVGSARLKFGAEFFQ
jgi:hypothetical protein